MSNPTRPCYGCQVFDDHPRHIIVTTVGGDEEPMHMDCCAEKRGCQVCADRRAGVDASVVGDEFRQHLLGLNPVQVDHVGNDDQADPHNLTTATVTEV